MRRACSGVTLNATELGASGVTPSFRVSSHSTQEGLAMKAILVLTTLLTACTFAKPEGKQEEKSLETTIIELDKQGWESWKNNDPTWFIENTTEHFQSISSGGISTKAEVVQGIPGDCQVAAYSLSDFKFTILDRHAVLLTYTADQDAVCGGEKAPSVLRVAVNYVRRDDKWLEAMYMQAP
jgi:hypothetical protein